MLIRFARVLMNEVDASPGGGAPTSAPTPTEGQAQAQPDEQPVTLSQLKGLLTDFKNSTEANVRRMVDGATKKKGDTKQETPQAQPPSSAVGASTSGPDAKKWNTFNRKVGALGMSDAQIEWAERAFEQHNPEDAAAWIDKYAQDNGIRSPSERTSSPATQSNQPAPQTAATPAPPAPAQAPQPATPHPAPTGSTAPAIPGADPLKWTKSQREAFLRSKAASPGELYDYRKNRDAWRAAKKIYAEALANVQVLPPDDSR